MPGSSGHRMLSRVRSHRKLRSATAAEVEDEKHHRRQTSDNVSASVRGSSSTKSDARTHWPPIEWDPLKLNPPTPPTADLPARPREGRPTTLRSKQSYAGYETRRPRMHHSDSGFSLVVHEGFDFGFERPESSRSHDDDDVHVKGWPSPTSSLDSGKSWFGDNDDDHHDDDDGAVKRSNELWGEAPSPRRRPQVASPDDPSYFIQRGGWKRRGIVFGGKTAEVRQKDDEVFNII
ncbi:hypothetical protein VP1G_04962 [Cytospora mali]|uniref:Uncharacterized protein n=1 Tax=Cytospora mali TaxID=578113 RepID=A0A194V1B7_CYTMA|nr:hypothetical protein VP1G_04962 [Valsa mali var. pyri (nom. inval.)]